MIARAPRAPGLGFEVVRPAPEPSPLRSDVAVFCGPTRRGPIGVPVRCTGWREYLRVFGQLDHDLDMPYAVRGYYANGGYVAWIVRLSAPGATVSQVLWKPTGLAELGNLAYQIIAASPGAWASKLRITVRYRARTVTGTPTIDLSLRSSEETEEHRDIPAAELVARIARDSQLVRIVPRDPIAVDTPRSFAVEELVLDQTGASALPELEDYLAAILTIADVPEPAIVAFPELAALEPGQAARVYRAAAASAEELRDRLVLVDLPRRDLRWHVDDLVRWQATVLGRGDRDTSHEDRFWRAAAAYHPWVRVDDPLGGPAQPHRDIAPSGHVAGVISSLDRERGAHSTPANSPLLDLIDLREDFTNDEQAVLNPAGLNLLRCVPSLGFSVWGGRTLDRTSPFVAHRRLIHRLVRAIRRVAEPLVFETNGPVLWFTFVRAVTAVLIEAWRSGGLAGTRPEEAFNVICDATTNPPEEIELGRCVCEIELAPAVPMEFILIRVALSRDGSLEVLS